MDELVKLVSQKTGVSEEVSRMAVETVLAYLKEKLPAPIAGRIDNVLGGAGFLENDLGGLVEGLGDILGEK
jgi:hypothetical protein